jgi:hypothetical protein
MAELGDDWEIVSRKPNDSGWILPMLVQLALLIPMMPATFSSATWTVRRKSTGAVHKLTARSEEEAKQRIELGLFDGDAA